MESSVFGHRKALHRGLSIRKVCSEPIAYIFLDEICRAALLQSRLCAFAGPGGSPGRRQYTYLCDVRWQPPTRRSAEIMTIVSEDLYSADVIHPPAGLRDAGTNWPYGAHFLKNHSTPHGRALSGYPQVMKLCSHVASKEGLENVIDDMCPMEEISSSC